MVVAPVAMAMSRVAHTAATPAADISFENRMVAPSHERQRGQY